jgi:hypothetical protein
MMGNGLVIDIEIEIETECECEVIRRLGGDGET